MSNSRKITFLKLVNGIFVPGHGFGDLGTTFPSPTKSMQGIEMEYRPEELVVILRRNGKDIITPITNVAVMTLAPNENV